MHSPTPAVLEWLNVLNTRLPQNTELNMLQSSSMSTAQLFSSWATAIKQMKALMLYSHRAKYVYVNFQPRYLSGFAPLCIRNKLNLCSLT
jgi:hypothetical protein